MANKPGEGSAAQKRVLWEVRKRYQLDNPPKQPARPLGAPARRATPKGRSLRRMSKGAARVPSTGSRRWIWKSLFILLLVVLLSGGVFGYKILAASNKISTTDTSILGQLKDLLLGSGEFLAGEQDGRINVLLIGVGGEGHSGENLADTIIVASIQPETGGVALLSIPRDLYAQVPGEDYFTKINAVHAYGESKKKGEGPETLKKTVEEITGLSIHYYGRIDFMAFKHIVDAVGGVNISIDNSFYDYWHKISFQAGTETMNGERALAYARARYVEGAEGGDFKRAERQQLLLLAVREKIFSVNTALDFRALNSILNSLSANIRTDLELWEMKRIYEMARSVEASDVHSIVLATGHNGVLVGSTEVLGGTPASVLRPRTGDYSEIRNIAANIFSDDVSSVITPSSSPAVESEPEEEVPAEKPILEIRNGTNITGLAAKASETLQGKGYEVVSIGNAGTRDVAVTTVYALAGSATEGAKTVAAEIGGEADSGLPAGEAESEADVLIILGLDSE